MTLPRLANPYFKDDFTTPSEQYEIGYTNKWVSDSWDDGTETPPYWQYGEIAPPQDLFFSGNDTIYDTYAKRVLERRPTSEENFIINFKIEQILLSDEFNGNFFGLHFSDHTDDLYDYYIRINKDWDVYAIDSAGDPSLIGNSIQYIRIVHDADKHSSMNIADVYISTTDGTEGTWERKLENVEFSTTRADSTYDIAITAFADSVMTLSALGIDYIEYSTDLSSETFDSDYTPTTSITSIINTQTTYSNTVTFTGSATSPTETTYSTYQWKSDAQGVLSNLSTFSTTTLSSGYHTITFKAYNDLGGWSLPDYGFVTVTTSTVTNCGIEGLNDLQKTQYDYGEFLRDNIDSNTAYIVNDYPHLTNTIPCVVIQTTASRHVPYSCADYHDDTNDVFLREVDIQLSVYSRRVLEDGDIKQYQAEIQNIDKMIDLVRHITLKKRQYLQETYDILDVIPEAVSTPIYDINLNAYLKTTLLRCRYALKVNKL